MHLLRRGDADDLRISSVSARYSAGYSNRRARLRQPRTFVGFGTSSRAAVTICITASTSAIARSFITRDSRRVCAEDR